MAKSFEVKKPPRQGGTFYPSSFSFLFGRKEKQKEAKRKEKPDDICKFKGCGKVTFSHFFDSILGKPLQICRAMYYA